MSLRASALLALPLLIVAIANPVASQGTPAPITELPQAAEVGFSDDFEGTSLGTNWSSTTTANGLAQFSDDYPHTGRRGFLLGQNLSGSASASLILSLDLSGSTDVFLDFWARATGSGEVRRVYISDNAGVSWDEIQNLDDLSQSFGHFPIDLATVAADKGRSLNAAFRIRFTYSNDSTVGNPGDGFVIDDVRVTTNAQAVAGFPLAEESFETPTLAKGFYPRSFLNAVAEITTDYPRSGSQSILLGQRASGSASASLELAVNLSGQTDVFLSFWTRATGSGEQRLVYISDNAGVSWTEIRDLSAASQSFSHIVIDLSNAAATAGRTLNNRFRIRFTYSNDSTVGDAGDGMVIDDVRLMSLDQATVTFPLPEESFEAASFGQGLYPRSSLAGIAELSTDAGRSGARGVFLGQRLAGSASATLELVLNLSGRTEAFLGFWVRSKGTGEERRVFISDNSGASWTEVLQLDRTSRDYKFVVLDLATIAGNQGLALNNKFRIRFTYANDSTIGDPGDGMDIDDVQLSATNLSSTVYLPLLSR